MKDTEILNINYYENDLPSNLNFTGSIAIDTETTGLSLVRDRLCLIQIADESKNIYIVKVDKPYNCPNLKKILQDKNLLKIFHYARFDYAMIYKCLGVKATPLFCTKIASRLCRTSTDAHGLKAIVKEFFNIDLNKGEQTSDWAVTELSQNQIHYAAGDVLYLHRIKDIMIEKLKRENRLQLAEQCFSFIPTRCELDLLGWDTEDIFSHH